MAFEIKVLKTDEARRRSAEAETTGKSFIVVGFLLGNAGHDPLDPTTALAPDPAQTECQAVVFGPKPTSSFTYANDACPVWECFLDKGEAVTLYSSLCLIAQVIASPIPGDPEILNNTTFLYGVSNFPQRPKLDTEPFTFFVGTQK